MGSLFLCHHGDLGSDRKNMGWSGQRCFWTEGTPTPNIRPPWSEHQGALRAAGQLPPQHLGLTLPTPWRAGPGWMHCLPGSRPVSEDPPRI